MPAFVAGKIEVELSGGAYTVRFAGEVSDRGVYTLDSSSAPKAMYLTGVEGANAGRMIPAIYQLVGDRLRICYGLDGAAPSAFATGTGQKLYLATYRRK
jgi:uncharacterized protein (TIGR03067 family)